MIYMMVCYTFISVRCIAFYYSAREALINDIVYTEVPFHIRTTVIANALF